MLLLRPIHDVQQIRPSVILGKIKGQEQGEVGSESPNKLKNR
ncbi:hypothetical protein [Paenibacillus guangzhouensis]|nr:hypothetical protein [Paenibacillus guangzhouensis]